MHIFQVGDLARVIDPCGHCFRIGEVIKVVDVNYSTSPAYVRLEKSSGLRQLLYIHQVEPTAITVDDNILNWSKL